MPTGQNSLDAARWQRATGGTGALEGTPHNTVHGTIGGNMGNYMSPLDPIFWMHHCNVDRLWVVWRNMGNADETNSLWRDFTFPNNFYQPNGTPISPIVRDQVSTDALGYTYDNVGSARVAAENAEVAAGNPLRGTVLAQLGAFSAVAGKVGIAHAPAHKARNAAAPAGGATYVILDGVTPPKEEGVALKVYLDTPKPDADTAADAPGYVGEVAFFGNHAGMSHGPKTVSFVLDATDAAKALNLGTKPIQVGVVPYHLDTGKAAAAVAIASTRIVTV